MHAEVRVRSRTSKKIEVRNGLRQRCALAPPLINRYIHQCCSSQLANESPEAGVKVLYICKHYRKLLSQSPCSVAAYGVWLVVVAHQESRSLFVCVRTCVCHCVCTCVHVLVHTERCARQQDLIVQCQLLLTAGLMCIMCYG